MRILLVEDDDVDAMSVSRAFKKNGVTSELVRARNGIEALEQLRKDSWMQQDGVPPIALIDIQMPKMTGLELLEQIRKDEALKDLCVFMLTTSDHQRDKDAASALRVADYFIKPFDFERFAKSIHTLNEIGEISSHLDRAELHSESHVLLVDDDRVVRKVVASVLKSTGYHVVEADNGLEAWDAVCERTPDLIITDINMPTMDGWELLAKMKSDPDKAATPVIMLSGNLDAADRSKAKELGAEIVVNKDLGATMIRIQAKKVLHKP